MKQAVMRQAYLTDTPLTTEELESKREHQPVALWPLLLVAAIVALVALTSTWDFPVELLQQRGIAP